MHGVQDAIRALAHTLRFHTLCARARAGSFLAPSRSSGLSHARKLRQACADHKAALDALERTVLAARWARTSREQARGQLQATSGESMMDLDKDQQQHIGLDELANMGMSSAGDTPGDALGAAGLGKTPDFAAFLGSLDGATAGGSDNADAGALDPAALLAASHDISGGSSGGGGGGVPPTSSLGLDILPTSAPATTTTTSHAAAAGTSAHPIAIDVDSPPPSAAAVAAPQGQEQRDDSAAAPPLPDFDPSAFLASLDAANSSTNPAGSTSSAAAAIGPTTSSSAPLASLPDLSTLSAGEMDLSALLASVSSAGNGGGAQASLASLSLPLSGAAETSSSSGLLAPTSEPFDLSAFSLPSFGEDDSGVADNTNNNDTTGATTAMADFGDLDQSALDEMLKSLGG